MLQPADLDRLSAELEDHYRPEKWMADNEVSFETIECVVSGALEAALAKVGEGKTSVQALGEGVANAFVLGWEAHRQFGKVRA